MSAHFEKNTAFNRNDTFVKTKIYLNPSQLTYSLSFHTNYRKHQFDQVLNEQDVQNDSSEPFPMIQLISRNASEPAVVFEPLTTAPHDAAV